MHLQIGSNATICQRGSIHTVVKKNHQKVSFYNIERIEDIWIFAPFCFCFDLPKSAHSTADFYQISPRQFPVIYTLYEIFIFVQKFNFDPEKLSIFLGE